MEKKPFALVIQGGGTRASFCLGLVKGMLGDHLEADYVFGTSAGALIGMMYEIGKPKQTEDAFLDYMGKKEFVGLGNVLTKGTLFDFSFFYDDLRKRHKELNVDIFLNSPKGFEAAATSCETGKVAYFKKGECDILKGIEASCALPLVSRPVIIDGKGYLDGGTTDPIPFGRAIEKGYEKIVVLANRPKGFRKEEGRRGKLVAKARYGKYPNWTAAFLNSIKTYNEKMVEMEKLEAEGRIFVIAPENPIDLGVSETDRKKLLKAIRDGESLYHKIAPSLFEYLDK